MQDVKNLPYNVQDWFRKLLGAVYDEEGTTKWVNLDFTNSNLTDILTRLHNDLQTIQGGTAGEFYHLTAAQHAALGASNTVTSVAVDTAMVDATRTYVVTASGKTLTLPQGTTARIGQDWTMIQDVVGNVTIASFAGDSFNLPGSPTSVVTIDEGTSLTFRLISTTVWSIV